MFYLVERIGFAQFQRKKSCQAVCVNLSTGPNEEGHRVTTRYRTARTPCTSVTRPLRRSFPGRSGAPYTSHAARIGRTRSDAATLVRVFRKPACTTARAPEARAHEEIRGRRNEAPPRHSGSFAEKRPSAQSSYHLHFPQGPSA